MPKQIPKAWAHVTKQVLLRRQLPNNTASIYENTTGDYYTVDSWFFKNGEPPSVFQSTNGRRVTTSMISQSKRH